MRRDRRNDASPATAGGVIPRSGGSEVATSAPRTPTGSWSAPRRVRSTRHPGGASQPMWIEGPRASSGSSRRRSVGQRSGADGRIRRVLATAASPRTRDGVGRSRGWCRRFVDESAPGRGAQRGGARRREMSGSDSTPWIQWGGSAAGRRLRMERGGMPPSRSCLRPDVSTFAVTFSPSSRRH